MTGLPLKGDNIEREIFLDGAGWCYFHDLLTVADVVREGRNPWLARELSGLRQSSASDLAAMVEFWRPAIEPYTRRH